MEEIKAPVQKNILTRTEASRYLRVSLPVLDAWRNKSDDPLPCVKTGKRVLFSITAIDQWFERQMMKGRID